MSSKTIQHYVLKYLNTEEVKACTKVRKTKNIAHYASARGISNRRNSTFVKRILQSICVTRDRVNLKFEARVQIYMAVLNICCEIQNSDRNVVRFSKINSYGISFWLVLFKSMRNIRFLGVW